MSTATEQETPTTESQDQITVMIDGKPITERLEELRPAHEAFLRLEAIVANFDKVQSGASRRGRTRTGGTSRPQEFLRLVKESGDEGISVAQAAEKMDGMNPNYLYRIAKDAVTDGTVTKGDDKLYRAA